MIDLPLDHDQYDFLLWLLAEDHFIDTRLTIYDENEKPIKSLRHPVNQMLDGAVQFDGSADADRLLTCSLLDPTDKLRFEADNVSRSALYADRFLGAHYGVYLPILDDFFYIPIFRGIITSFGRAGLQVDIEAQGKEALALDPHFATQGYTIKHGMEIGEAIKFVMRKLGERRFRLPELRTKIHNDHPVTPQSEPWLIVAGGKHISGLSSIHRKTEDSEREVKQNVPALIRLAKGNRELMYDGRGYLRAPKRHDNVQFVFRDGINAVGTGKGPTLLSRPNVSYDPLEFKNHWVVTGGQQDGKRRVTAAASLPPSNPLSPKALGRNGTLRFMSGFSQADDLKTHDECKERAEEELKRVKDSGVTVEFECLPMPMLEIGDRVRVAHGKFRFDFVVETFTLPLTSSQAMTVGDTEKVHKWARHTKTGKPPRKRRHGGKGHHRNRVHGGTRPPHSGGNP